MEVYYKWQAILYGEGAVKMSVMRLCDLCDARAVGRAIEKRFLELDIPPYVFASLRCGSWGRGRVDSAYKLNRGGSVFWSCTTLRGFGRDSISIEHGGCAIVLEPWSWSVRYGGHCIIADYYVTGDVMYDVYTKIEKGIKGYKNRMWEL